MNKHILLIGFKNAGKTTIGRTLADNLKLRFIDLDHEIEQLYFRTHHIAAHCRDIMKTHGEMYFRQLESKTLQICLEEKTTCIIALGGGTPLQSENQLLLQTHLVFHITASQHLIFERIIQTGIPAFFPSHQNPQAAFLQLWEERMPVYQSLAKHTISNDQSVTEVANEIQKVLFQ